MLNFRNTNIVFIIIAVTDGRTQYALYMFPVYVYFFVATCLFAEYFFMDLIMLAVIFL